MENLIFSGRENVQVSPIIIVPGRKMSGTKHLITGLLLILFLQEPFFAQCPSGVSGSGFMTANMCAPASVTLYYEFSSATEMPQTSYRVQFIWGDGTARNVTQPVQTRTVGGLTQWYVRVELNHTFPVNGLCEYVVLMALCNSGGSQCQDSRQTQIVANWHQDDIGAASGRIAMDPAEKNICEGLPLIDFQFTDISNFACNLKDFPLSQKPDHMPRHEQFIYGTNPVTGKGIPDLIIKAGTAETPVRLTDASGNPVPNIWTVDPLTGETVAAYSTPSGFFEGPVITIPVNAATGEYSLNKTFKISFDGTGASTQDQFQVTVRNWNICNPWNGSQTNPNEADANTATSQINIVSVPDASATVMNTPVVCSDAAMDLTLKSSVNYTVFEYTTETVPGGISWIPGKEPDNGIINDTDGNGTETLIRHLAHYYNSPVTVTYTIVPKGPGADACIGVPITRSVIVQPSVSVSAQHIETVCSNMPVFFDVNTESSGTYGVKYSWTVSAPPGIAGAFNGPVEGNPFDTDIFQVLSNFYPVPQKVTYTITGYTLDQEGALQCAGIPFQKDIWIEPEVELSPMNLLPVVCSGDMTFINVHTPYPEPSKVRYTWTVNAPPEVIGAENGPSNLMEGITIDVPINQMLINLSPLPQVVRYEIRGYLITDMGIICPPEQILIEEVRVNPSTNLTIQIQPVDYVVCQGDKAMFVAEATGASLTWQWEVDNGGGFIVIADDPVISGANTNMLTISGTPASFNGWIFRARVTGICGAPVYTGSAKLTVIPPPVVTNNPASMMICQEGKASFLANGSGYNELQWQVSTDNGISFANVVDDGVMYMNSVTGQLSVLSATITMNNNLYRLAFIGNCTTIYSNPATLIVNANPVVDFTAIDPIEVNESVPVVINGNPTGGSGVWTQHHWSGDVGPLDDLTIQAPTFNSAIPGTFSLSYRVTDNNSCIGEDNLSVIVKVLTGNEEIRSNSYKFSVYPNPVADFVRLGIDNYDIGNLSYQIIGINGMILQQKKVENNEMQISLKNLNTGIYFLRIVENGAERATFKLVKE